MCNSRATLSAAAALAGGGERMRVVHPPGEPPPVPAPPRHAEPAVATLAHVIPRKRHADVLEALPQLPAVRWVVIGDGPELPRLRARAAELGVERRVTWAGELEPAAALRDLARCHVMALPSVDEAFGVAYVEALSCGVPAIACEGEGGPAEIAAAGDGMVLVPPRDPPALAAALSGLLADPGRLEALSRAARRTALDHFGTEACGRATVDAYRAALARAGGPV